MSTEKSPTLKIAVCEMTSTSSLDENLIQVMELLEDTKSADVAFFPENSLKIRTDLKGAFTGVSLEDKAFSAISEFASNHGVHVVLGSVPIADSEVAKIKNSTVHIQPSGHIDVVYTKVHLFDVEIEGGPTVLESADYHPGESREIIEINGWKIGLSICYDVRFSDLYLEYARSEVDIIAIPAAFTVPTGKAHWEVLLRARAIESQCYVVAAAQTGSHEGLRESYGHSLVADPWGEILANATPEKRVLHLELTQSKIHKVRRQIPMASHRKASW